MENENIEQIEHNDNVNENIESIEHNDNVNEPIEPIEHNDTIVPELNQADEELKQLRDEIKSLREYLSKKFTENERGDAGETDPIEDYLNSDNSLTHRILEKYERMK